MICPHGIPDGAPCDAPDCYNHRANPLPTDARVPVRLGDWTAQQLTRSDPPAPNPANHAPEAVETWRATQALGERDNASGDMTRGRGFIGVREDGRTAHGSNGWNWLRKIGTADGKPVRQDPPVFVRGAVYADSDDGHRIARDIGEREAQREALAVALCDAPLEWLERPPRAQRKRIRSTTGNRR